MGRREPCRAKTTSVARIANQKAKTSDRTWSPLPEAMNHRLKNCSGSPVSKPSSSPQYRQPDFSSNARIAALERLVEVQTSCHPWLLNESKLNPRPHLLALGSTISNEINGFSKKYRWSRQQNARISFCWIATLRPPRAATDEMYSDRSSDPITISSIAIA